MGDAGSSDWSQGGNDIIDSGAGNDRIWGDFQDIVPGINPSSGGNDIFIFAKGCGNDTIYDFDNDFDLTSAPNVEHDLIDLRAYHLTWDQLAARTTDYGDHAVIQLTKSDSIDVYYFNGPPQQTDFIL